MKDALVELVTSKKFLVAILGILIPPVNAALGWELTMEMLAPVTAYIVGQGIADHGKGALRESARQAVGDITRRVLG